MQHDWLACSQLSCAAFLPKFTKNASLDASFACWCGEVANTHLLAEPLIGERLTGLMPLRWLETEGLVLLLTSLQQCGVGLVAQSEGGTHATRMGGVGMLDQHGSQSTASYTLLCCSVAFSVMQVCCETEAYVPQGGWHRQRCIRKP